ncbi:MAG: 6-pyruvoyl trahydropterin synthase family protein [Planctomycetota bacterium]
MKIGITEYIDCAHFIPGHKTCGSLHGHTYRVDITVEDKNSNTWVMDFYDLKDKTWQVLKELDHKQLNDILQFPSCEGICNFIYEKLGKIVPILKSVRVYEGPDKWAEISK